MWGGIKLVQLQLNFIMYMRQFRADSSADRIRYDGQFIWLERKANVTLERRFEKLSFNS